MRKQVEDAEKKVFNNVPFGRNINCFKVEPERFRREGRSVTEWVCMKCKHRWVDNSKEEPRQCPVCGDCVIYVPKVIKRK